MDDYKKLLTEHVKGMIRKFDTNSIALENYIINDLNEGSDMVSAVRDIIKASKGLPHSAIVQKIATFWSNKKGIDISVAKQYAEKMIKLIHVA